MSNYVPPTTPINQPPPQYPYGQQPQYPGGPPPPPKKGSKVLLWGLVGCTSLLLIGVTLAITGGYFVYNKAKEMGFDPELMEKQPALAVAKILTATNPDVELVSVDEEKGLITLREKKSGKVTTINLEDAQKGRIVFEGEGKEAVTIEASGEGESGTVEVKTPEGSARFSAGSNVTLPDWIPEYPDAEITGNFSMQSDKTDSGSFSFTTQDSIDEVISFYEDGLKESGLKVSTNLLRQGGKVTLGTAVGEGADKKQSAYVNAQATDSGTQVTVTFQITK
jgi:hypothetical protein